MRLPSANHNEEHSQLYYNNDKRHRPEFYCLSRRVSTAPSGMFINVRAVYPLGSSTNRSVLLKWCTCHFAGLGLLCAKYLT